MTTTKPLPILSLVNPKRRGGTTHGGTRQLENKESLKESEQIDERGQQHQHTKEPLSLIKQLNLQRPFFHSKLTSIFLGQLVNCDK